MSKTLLIVIPAFDEANTISDVVIKCRKHGDVLVVNDGSTDQTESLARKSGAIVVVNEKNLGYEASLNVGYIYALHNKYDIMLTMDADGQLPDYKIPIFIDKIQSGDSVVIGKRNNIPRATERLLSKVSRYFSGIEDLYCGMKAYSLKVIKKKAFSKYNSIGTSLAIDYIALKFPASNVEIDITPRNGKSKFGGRIISELRLTTSCFFGIIRFFIIWCARKYAGAKEKWKK